MNANAQGIVSLREDLRSFGLNPFQWELRSIKQELIKYGGVATASV